MSLVACSSTLTHQQGFLAAPGPSRAWTSLGHLCRDYGGVGPGTPGFWAAWLALCKGCALRAAPGTVGLWHMNMLLGTFLGPLLESVKLGIVQVLSL